MVESDIFYINLRRNCSPFWHCSPWCTLYINTPGKPLSQYTPHKIVFVWSEICHTKTIYSFWLPEYYIVCKLMAYFRAISMIYIEIYVQQHANTPLEWISTSHSIKVTIIWSWRLVVFIILVFNFEEHSHCVNLLAKKYTFVLMTLFFFHLLHCFVKEQNIRG